MAIKRVTKRSPGRWKTSKRSCLLLGNGPAGTQVTGDVFPLFDEFDGNLLYFPEFTPVIANFGQILSGVYKDPRQLFVLEPRQFEELVADIWKRFGYLVELTSRTRDGGRDIIAVKQAEASFRILIECKRYAQHRKVGVRTVRELYGVKTDEASKAILATTSSFTTAARDLFASHIWEVEPKDYNGVVDWVRLAVRGSSL